MSCYIGDRQKCPGAAGGRAGEGLVADSFGLGEVVAHIRLAVHGDGCAQVLVALLGFIDATEKLSETEVAVGDQRSHASWLGKPEGVPVVALRASGVEAVGMQGYIGENLPSMGCFSRARKGLFAR